ncbi:MAG: RNA polymerase subunit sigma-70, partial [Rhizobiales bacterium]|nr:RNA polymerase subunit sigma-70 [Hyphomicrobiales bacterium]
AGIRLLDEIEPARVAAYQPYWAARAELLARADAPEARDEALLAYERAIDLSNDPAIRAHLATRRVRLLS